MMQRFTSWAAAHLPAECFARGGGAGGGGGGGGGSAEDAALGGAEVGSDT